VIWILLAAAAVFGYLLYRMHQRKKHQQRISYYVTTTSLWVSIPSDVPQEQGEKIANDLDDSRRTLWQRLSHIYGKVPRSMYVGTVFVVHGTVHEDHPLVMWYTGNEKLRLSLRNDMMRWWLLELHNVYRYGIYGHEGVYLPENAPAQEQLRYALAVRYCEDYARRLAA